MVRATPANSPCTLFYYPRRSFHAGHQRCGGIDRFPYFGVRISLEQLKKDVPLPCILHWNQNHFVVCYDIKKKRSGYRFYIADPARQLISYSEEEFKKCWLSTKVNGEEKGAALALEPGPEFQGQGDEEESGSRSLRFFLKYLSPYRKQLIQLILGMLTASLLQLIFLF